METAKIILKNGSIDVEVNATTFMVDVKPSEELFEDLSLVKIQQDGNERIIRGGKFIECPSIDGKFCFTIIEVPEEEQRLSDIENALVELAEIITEG